MPENKAVIWDMDGVIADTAPHHFAAWRAVFRERGINYSEAAFRGNFGKRNDTIITAVMGDLNPAELAAVAEKKEELFRQQARGNLQALPGVVKLLAALRDRSLKQALGSSAPIENIRLIIAEVGVADYFQAIVSGDEVAEGKPSPDGFLRAAAKLDCPTQHCVVIEDAVAGVAAARSAGMKCLAVTNTNPADKLSDADRVADSLEEITADDIINL